MDLGWRVRTGKRRKQGLSASHHLSGIDEVQRVGWTGGTLPAAAIYRVRRFQSLVSAFVRPRKSPLML